MAILMVVSSFVAKRSSAHVVATAKKKQQGCCADQPAVPRRMIGTYYTTEDGFKSTLILNNKGPNQIMVTPILHSQNGRTFTASPVAVDGRSSPEVDLNLQASIAGPEFRSGSFEFTYEGRLLEMGGGLRIVNAEKSLIFDEQMLEPGMKFPSSQLEGVYAIPFGDSQVSVIVTNTTAQTVTVNGDAVFSRANGHHKIQDEFGPYETKVVNLPHGLVKKATAGAVSLNHNGGKGALMAMIHLQDPERGYSESVNFINPGGKITARQGAGLRLGSVDNDPLKTVIAVRNIGESATTVTAAVPYSKQNGDMGTIALPQVSLEPGEIKLLNTSNPQLRQNDFATAGLEIKYTGAPGSVIASASSVSQSGNHVFALPMKDPQGSLSSTGGYPWFINESSSTVVFIKNTTDEPQNFILNIIYPGGNWVLIHPPIPAGQTIAVDVRKLRDSQQKGVEDSVIPIDATSGHISWSAHGTAKKALIGRAQTVDFVKGMSATYECQCQCGYTWLGDTRMSPADPTLALGQQITIFPEALYTDCFGTGTGNPIWARVNSFIATSSSNPSVVGYSSLTAIANNVGQATVFAQWTDQIATVICPPPDIECPPPPAQCPCGCDLSRPSVGASTTVTVQAPQVTFSASALNSYLPTNGNNLSFTATINPSTANGIIRFEIYDISAYRGDTMNRGTETTPDYDFSGSQSGFGSPSTQGSGASLVHTISTSSNVNSATVNVYSRDYGGQCKIRAFATFGETQVAATYTGTSSNFARIPKDDNGNNMPDAGWIVGIAQINEQSTAPQSDNDNNPTGSGMNGDGFTDFEEYRGVTVRGTHRRLNPFQKDLFILSELPQGIGDSNILPVTKHALNSGELDTGRVVNFNHTNSGFGGNIQSHFNQQGLRVVDGGLGTLMIYGEVTVVGPPHAQTGNVNIYTLFIRQASPPNNNTTNVDPFDSDKTRQTLGHEIGHGSSVSHCIYLVNCPPGKFSIMLGGYFPVTSDPTNERWNNIPHTYDTSDTGQIRIR
jgi:hypothetical protein